MRNLNQYPITVKEKLSALKAAVELFLAEGKIGDIRPAALKAVAREIGDAEWQRIDAELDFEDDGDEPPLPTPEEVKERLEKYVARKRAEHLADPDRLRNSLRIADELEKAGVPEADGPGYLKETWMRD